MLIEIIRVIQFNEVRYLMAVTGAFVKLEQLEKRKNDQARTVIARW